MFYFLILLLLFFLGILDLGLLRTSHLLHSVLSLLALLAWHTLGLGEAVSCQSILWLELLGKVKSVVDESKTAALSTTEHGAEAEAEDHIGLGLVHASELFTDFGFFDRCLARMQHIDDIKLIFHKKKNNFKIYLSNK